MVKKVFVGGISSTTNGNNDPTKSTVPIKSEKPRDKPI